MWTDKLDTRVDFKRLTDEGTFEGHASIFGNIDLGGDVIVHGAFENSLKASKAEGRMPKFLWHNTDKPLGIFEDMAEDKKGLLVKGRFNLGTQIGREAFSDVKIGAVDGLSIGFVPKKVSRDETSGIRRIEELLLKEVSIVTFPMNEGARINAVKSIAQQVKTIREFEDFLRDVGGFSRNTAKAIATSGFKHSHGDFRDGTSGDPFDAALVNLAAQLS